VNNLAGQLADLTGEEIESGDTRTERGDRATTLTQANGRDLFLHGPGPARVGGWLEAVYRRALDIRLTENLVYRTPNGGFAEECCRGENAFDFRKRAVGHRGIV
jgi:hypothetical protein